MVQKKPLIAGKQNQWIEKIKLHGNYTKKGE